MLDVAMAKQIHANFPLMDNEGKKTFRVGSVCRMLAICTAAKGVEQW